MSKIKFDPDWESLNSLVIAGTVVLSIVGGITGVQSRKQIAKRHLDTLYEQDKKQRQQEDEES